MRVISPFYEIEDDICQDMLLKRLEKSGRTCYKSEDKITESSAEKFVAMLIKSGHESVIEHEKLTVRFVCDRGVTHELVRHRLASFSQESTRYCNYSKDKHDNQLTFIRPSFWDESDVRYTMWLQTCKSIENTYIKMIESGATPQEARSILPNSLKTEIVVTANLRQWREILRQRTSPNAHPQIREVMIPLLNELKQKLPVIFSNISIK